MVMVKAMVMDTVMVTDTVMVVIVAVITLTTLQRTAKNQLTVNKDFFRVSQFSVEPENFIKRYTSITKS